jgi:hypothetical protein
MEKSRDESEEDTGHDEGAADHGIRQTTAMRLMGKESEQQIDYEQAA